MWENRESGYLLTFAQLRCQRGLGAPLMVMIFNSIWSLAVSCAGVLTGPAALPWPGLPFFTTLSVLSLLISKHLLV